MNFFRPFIDLIYPPRCSICEKFLWKDRAKRNQQELLFCEPCLDGFSEITSPFCFICGRPFASEVDEDHLCENCLRKRPYYDAMRAPYLYEGDIMAAIHQFKYARKSHLANSLGFLLTSFARKWLDNTDSIVMMPVPLHPKKLRERNFNQSLLLARYAAPLLGTELDFVSLRRIKYTQPQTALKSDERRKNVRGAFEVVDSKVVKGRSVLLVDDVTTTGSTLNECARTLKRAGAREVFCLTLARTSGQ
jgi:ComF family protein